LRTKNIHDPIDLSNIPQIITDISYSISDISNVDISNGNIYNMDCLNGNNLVTDNLSEITLSTIDISIDSEHINQINQNGYAICESIDTINDIVENVNKLAEIEEENKGKIINQPIHI